jgi:hypothetical protein
MKYWHLASVHRPCLAKMGSDLCSVPGECTLSYGYSGPHMGFSFLS